SVSLGLGNVSRFHHRVQHNIAPRDGSLRVPVWIQAAGALDKTGKQSGLRQCELAHILAKKGLRRLAESVHRKAAALPQRNLVRIKLKNLLLGEAMLELKGDNDLKELALERALRRKEKFLRQLHRQRGRAAEIAAVSQHVMPGPRDHRVVIHSSGVDYYAMVAWA